MQSDSISVTGDSDETSAKRDWSSAVLTFSQPLALVLTGRSMGCNCTEGEARAAIEGPFRFLLFSAKRDVEWLSALSHFRPHRRTRRHPERRWKRSARQGR